MYKTILLVVMITMIAGVTNCQSLKADIQNRKKAYFTLDTLTFKASNISKDSVRFYVGLKCFYKGKWEEIDNDIFADEPRENEFFGVKPGSSIIVKVPVSALRIDSMFLREKFRLFIGVLPVNTLLYQHLQLPSFKIKSVH
ncbi:hypothetical protein [Filimonas effusa]|uniref:Uncharacterized protein n=1 Tax=Filimonas effusa TaxID=2508721 RepID=A0A4Q1DAT5_9BACT|nr:hypothetical protein [Filimonas effusa]RXK86521.1 hypothetical protein ESB13_06860 [Filimonas effusa]